MTGILILQKTEEILPYSVSTDFVKVLSLHSSQYNGLLESPRKFPSLGWPACSSTAGQLALSVPEMIDPDSQLPVGSTHLRPQANRPAGDRMNHGTLGKMNNSANTSGLKSGG